MSKLERLNFHLATGNMLGSRCIIAASASVVTDYAAPTHLEVTCDLEATAMTGGASQIVSLLVGKGQPWDYCDVVFTEFGRQFTVDADQLLPFMRGDNVDLDVGIIF